MKSRPEYRAIFASPAMLFRALHIISTQRYRLPVRRYIVDLFSLELGPALVAALDDAAARLTAHAAYKPTTSEAARLSMFGPLGRPRRTSVSDEEDEDELAVGVPLVPEQPGITLQPVHRIVGFDVGEIGVAA